MFDLSAHLQPEITMDGFLVVVVIVIALILLLSFGQGKNSKKEKTKEQQKQKKEEEKNYKYYIGRFDSQYTVKLKPETTSVAGVRYKNDDTKEERQAIIKRCKSGEKLMLVPDELNKYDRDAIKVLRLNGEQIGFLNTDLALEIKARLQQRLRVDASIKEIREDKGIKEVYLELVKYSRKSS